MLEFGLAILGENSISILVCAPFLIIHLGFTQAMNEIQGSEIFLFSLLDLFHPGGSCCQSAVLACFKFFNKRSA